MKFSSQKTDLSLLTYHMETVCGKAHLESFHLSLTGKELKIVATDGEVSVRAIALVDGTEDGECIIPAKKFNALLKTLNDQKLEISSDGAKFNIRRGSSKHVLACISTNDFPKVRFPDKFHFRLPSVFFSEAIAGLISIPSAKEQQAYRAGVLLRLESQRVTLVATDGHRLSSNSNIDLNIPENFRADAIIPIKAINEVYRCIEKASASEEIFFQFQDKIETGFLSACFLIDKFVYKCQLFHENYPDYMKAVDQVRNNSIKITIPRVALSQVLTRSKIFLNEADTQRTRFMFRPDTVDIIATNGNDFSTETLPCVCDRELIFDLDANYFLDLLKAIKDDHIVINFKSTNEALYFTVDSNKDFHYIICTMMITEKQPV